MRADLLSLPRILYGAGHIRAIEPVLAQRLGIPLYQVMEAAGAEAWKRLRQTWPDAKRLLVLCGGGNNAGDGYVLARLAHRAGLTVQLYQHRPSQPLAGDAGRAQRTWHAEGGTVRDLEEAWEPADLCIDALVGTGLKGGLRSPLANVVKRINSLPVPVFSLDIPSGLNGETGTVETEAVQASATLTFVGVKPGLLTGQALDHIGRLWFAPLQLGDALDLSASVESSSAQVTLLKPELLKPWLPARRRSSHKGDHGRLLVIGGNEGMAGAVRLASEAALRCGAGLVAVLCHGSSLLPVQMGRPELMVREWQAQASSERLAWASALVLGPGLGLCETARARCRAALSASVPMLLDADALNLLAEFSGEFEPDKRRWILTPHPGEAARLLGQSVREIESDRFAAVRALQRHYGGVVVLKGAGTLIYDGQEMALAVVGNAGLATGGSGDLLSGIIGGLLAQGLPPMQAACAGVLIHGEAADSALAPGPRGMLPSDLLPQIRRWVNFEVI